MSRTFVLAAVLSLLLVVPAGAERIDLGTIGEYSEVTVIESNDSRTVVRFDVGAFNRKEIQIEDESYYEIACGKEGILRLVGEPELPRFCRSIMIPDNAKMQIKVLASEYQDFSATPVAPSKGDLLRGTDPASVPYKFGDVYQSANWYPGELAELREPYILRDFRGTVIELNAFQYNPFSQRLRVYTSITVEVTTAGPGEINVIPNRVGAVKLVPDFELIYQRRFINYDTFSGRYDSVGEIGELLIITYDAYHMAMQPLVDWKKQKGIKTTIVDISIIGNNASAIDLFIEEFYDSTDLAFVLLVGDNAQITRPDGTGKSDPVYAKITADAYPDFFIGRFSAEGVGDVGTQVERTITYERDSPGFDWFHKGAGIASNDPNTGQGGEHDWEHSDLMRDDLLAFTYTEVDRIYPVTSATISDVNNALNNGRSIVNYTGHGGPQSWSTTGYSNSNVNNDLVNDNMLPFIISVACNTGQFDIYTCLGEAFLRATNGSAPTGAIGFYGSLIGQSWTPPMDCQDEVVDLLVAMEKTSYGGLCFNGACKMIDLTPGTGANEYNAWTLFGDPSLQVRTDTPGSMVVNHNGAVFFQSPNYLVTVVGIEGALCALYHDGTLYGSAYTGIDGVADISINGSLPIGATLTLTITAFNKQTFLDDVQVTSELAIIHTPLTDTKDTLNDYQVMCQIYSSAPLIADSLFLWYEINSTWTSVTLKDTLAEEDFVSYIPAQPAGTVINYYLYAANTIGNKDTTETFTFRIIDYAMILDPTYMVQTVPSGDTAWYDLVVTNDGVLPDDYSLAVTYFWPTSIWDETGTTQITGTGTLNPDDDFSFKVAVEVPETSVFGQGDSATVTVTSTGNPAIYEQAGIWTFSAGTPLSLPFYEPFATTTIDTMKWDIIQDVAVNDIGLSEPSPPYSLNLNGNPSGSDMLVSGAIDLGSVGGGITISYAYQQTGGGDSPENNDDLLVEYLNDNMEWVLLHRHLGADPDMSIFETFSTGAPVDAYHSLFQIRFRNFGTTGPYDDWFVDDIRIDFGPAISVTPPSFYVTLPQGDSTEDALIVANAGPGGLNYSITVIPEFTRNPVFDRLLTAGQVNPAKYEYLDGWIPADLPKGVDDPFRGPDVVFNAGGPDNFGYIWIDSDEPGGPTFAWIDILATGTDISSSLDDDNFVGPYPIGFDFPFYDGSYNELWIASNGFLGFGPTTNYSTISNTWVPNSSAPNNTIFWCWDDLDILANDSGRVVYKNLGDRFVIEFYKYAEYDNTGGEQTITAEVILYPNGDIRMQYLAIDPGFVINENTVGIENEAGSDGLQVSHNTTYLHDNLAIEVTKPVEWLILSSANGQLSAETADTIIVKFSAAEADTGLYQANINIYSNDPDPADNPWVVPAEMYVGEGGPPGIPVLFTPEDGSTIDDATPEFTWSATAGTGGTYTLEYAQDEVFESGLVTVPDLTDAGYIPTTELVDGVWYWHVQAFNLEGGSGYQETPFSFTVKTWITGDVNDDGLINVTDAVFLLDYIFGGGPAPDPLESGDVDCNDVVNVSDVTYLIAYIFSGGPPPCEH